MAATNAAETFVLVGTTPRVKRGVFPIALSTQSPILAEFAGWDKCRVRIIDYETTKSYGQFSVSTYLTTLSFAPDGKKLLALDDGGLLICREPWKARSYFREKLPKGTLHGAWLDEDTALIAGSEGNFDVWFAVVDARRKRNPVRILHQELPSFTFHDENISIHEAEHAYVSPSGLIGFVGSYASYSPRFDYRSLALFYQLDENHSDIRLERAIPIDDPDVRVSIADSGRTMLVICGRREHAIKLVDRSYCELDSRPFGSEYNNNWITYRNDTLLHRRENMAVVQRIVDGRFHKWADFVVPRSTDPMAYSTGRNIFVGHNDLVQRNCETYLAVDGSAGDQTSVFRLVDYDLVQLSSKDSKEKIRAAQSAGSRRYVPAVPRLISLIGDPDKTIKKAAIRALATIRDSSALKGLIAAVGVDPDLETRECLFESILIFSEADVDAAITQCLSLSEADARVGAIRTLEHLDLSNVPDRLLQSIRDPELKVRIAAARALGKPGYDRAVPALINALQEDTQDEVVCTVAESLAHIGAPIVLEYLIRRLGDGANAIVQTTIRTALSRFRVEEVYSAIVKGINDPGASRRGAVLILADTTVPEAFDGLMIAVCDLDSEVRRLAAQALGVTKRLDACIALIGRLNDESLQVELAVQQAAIDLLAHAGSLSDDVPRELDGPIDLGAFATDLISSGDLDIKGQAGPGCSLLTDLISATMQCVEFPTLLNAVESLSHVGPPRGKAVALATCLICANALRKMKRWAETIQIYGIAAELAEQINAPQVEWRSLGAVAECFEAIGDDTSALESYRLAMQVIDREWVALIEEDKLRAFFGDKASLYERAGICALRLGHGALSLEILEKAKTRYLGDLIARRRYRPRTTLQEDLMESWGVGGESVDLQLAPGVSSSQSPKDVEIVGIASTSNTSHEDPILPRALAAFEEAIATGQSQLTSDVATSFVSIASHLSVHGDGGMLDDLEEIYRILDHVRLALKNNSLPLKGVERMLFLAQLKSSWEKLRSATAALSDEPYPLNFIEPLISTKISERLQFELALDAVIEAINLVLHHEVVVGVRTNRESTNQNRLVFLTKSSSESRAAGERPTFVRSAVQRYLQSEWRYVTKLARGESSSFRDIKSTLNGESDVSQIEFAVTDRGTIAYVTRGKESRETADGLPELRGDADLQLFTLPKITFSELQRRLWIGPDSWFGSLRNHRQSYTIKSFCDAMDCILPWLHSELMLPLIPHLKHMKVEKLRIIPHRALHLIPFAALNAGDAEDNHRYVIDDFEVEYAPSATLLRICSDRQRQSSDSPSVTIVTDPAGNLRFAGFEAEQVAEAFNHDRVQRAANRTQLQEAASQGLGSVFHFCGHGRYRWEDPMKSSLSLGAGGSLTLEDLFSQKIEFPQTNLVVLAACETTVVDPQDQADEYLGLASGFIFGGTRAVISTLWPVDDLSTALLMKEFYRLHLKEKLPIGSALKGAQLWLRDSTAEQMKLVEFWEQRYDASGCSDADAFRAKRRYKAKPESQPFMHPYYWAGFTLSGAS